MFVLVVTHGLENSGHNRHKIFQGNLNYNFLIIKYIYKFNTIHSELKKFVKLRILVVCLWKIRLNAKEICFKNWLKSK